MIFFFYNNKSAYFNTVWITPNLFWLESYYLFIKLSFFYKNLEGKKKYVLKKCF